MQIMLFKKCSYQNNCLFSSDQLLCCVGLVVRYLSNSCLKLLKILRVVLFVFFITVALSFANLKFVSDSFFGFDLLSQIITRVIEEWVIFSTSTKHVVCQGDFLMSLGKIVQSTRNKRYV